MKSNLQNTNSAVSAAPQCQIHTAYHRRLDPSTAYSLRQTSGECQSGTSSPCLQAQIFHIYLNLELLNLVIKIYNEEYHNDKDYYSNNFSDDNNSDDNNSNNNNDNNNINNTKNNNNSNDNQW